MSSLGEKTGNTDIHKLKVVSGYWGTLMHQKCPRCREGYMFKDRNPYHLRTILKMYHTCPVCGQAMEIEPGFYYGTAYVSYALTVAFSASTFVASWILIGFSTEDHRVFWWLGINGALLVLLQPYFMRLSRTLWLSFFVRFNKDWQVENAASERIILPSNTPGS